MPAFRVVAFGTFEPYRVTPLSELVGRIPASAKREVPLEPGETMDVPFLKTLDFTEADIERIKKGGPLEITVHVDRDDNLTRERVHKAFRRMYDSQTGGWFSGWPGMGGPLADTD